VSDSTFIYTGSTAEPVQDEITVNNRPLDLSDATVEFFMREADSEVLKIDGAAATIVEPENGTISYEWEDVDVDTPGEYFAWWRITETATTDPIDTPEFEVIIGQHAPGYRVRTGAIYRRAKGIIPISWSALENSDKYGDARLQERIETVKLRVLGATVLVEDEEIYDIRVQEYLAKLAAIQIIPTAVDYWMDQKVTVSATGTNETVSFPDRIAALWKVYERLLAEVASDQTEIEEILGVEGTRPGIHTPAFSEGTDIGFRTPLPGKHYRNYHFSDRHKKPWFVP
jgi:hypothetical protein